MRFGCVFSCKRENKARSVWLSPRQRVHPRNHEKPGRALLLTLGFLSGLAALIHQIIWIRRFVDVIGASSDAFASVVGAFFLGLASGGWAASRVQSWQRDDYLRAISRAELTAGLLAFGILFLPHASHLIQSIPLPHSALRLVVAAVLLIPPAFCLGLTAPWFIVALGWSGEKRALHFYAVNTLGAVFGVFLAMFLLLPLFGTFAVGCFAALINVTIFFILWSRVDSSEAAPPTQRRPQTEAVGMRLGVLAFFSGFLVLCAEVVVQLQLTQVLINSAFASGSVLALVLIGLSAGALLVSPITKLHRSGADGSFAWLLAFSLLGAALQPVLFWLGFGSLHYLDYQKGLLRYATQMMWPSMLCIVLPFLLMGLTFPALLRLIEEKHPRRGFGVLLAWNGLGGWLGSEIAQGVLLPRFGLWGTLPLVAVLGAVVMLICAGPHVFSARVPAILVFVIATAAWVLFSNNVHVATSRESSVHAFRIGREGIVAVMRSNQDEHDWRILFNNSYTLGGSKAAANQERQAHLPILLHGSARSIATLGLATGSTAGGATVHSSIKSIEAIELSPLAAEFARKFFRPYNRQVFEHPAVQIILGDARWVIALRAHKYDVVIGDLFLPWRTGEGRLFTVEHFRNVKRSLAQNGLYCQWLPMYQLTERQFDAITRTFLEVFPNAFLIRGDFYAGMPIVGLVGGRPLSSIDWDAVNTGCIEAREQTKDPLVRHVEGIAMMVVGPLQPVALARRGPIITLNNGWLEWDAGLNLLEGRQPWFTAVPFGEYIRSCHRLGKNDLPEDLRRWHEAGQFFFTLSVAHEGKVNTEGLLRRLPDYMPLNMLRDNDAYWHAWPAKIKPGVHINWDSPVP